MQNNLISEDYDDIKEISGYPKIPLGHAKDLRNQKYYSLTPLYRTNNQEKRTMWVCKCDCGNIVSVRSDSIQNGNTKGCGCLHSESTRQIGYKNRRDLTNQRFGKLLVLSYADNKNGHACWNCLCDCGKMVIVSSTSLIEGNTTSCGCYQREISGELNFKDLTNQRFGKLVVLYLVSREHGNVIWHCKCDCGVEKDIKSSYLLNGLKSCGCLMNKSAGELKIQQLLTSNNILYENQKTFNTCRFKESNQLAKFDFYLNNQYLIEYDGNIHFIEGVREKGWNTLDKFQKRIKRDNFKNQWCKENNIPLIRIPYWHYDDLCLEDLLLETTQFRVV